MKRLCVFYKEAFRWLGRPVQWIICKECEKRLMRGEALYAPLDKAFLGYDPSSLAAERKRRGYRDNTVHRRREASGKK